MFSIIMMCKYLHVFVYFGSPCLLWYIWVWFPPLPVKITRLLLILCYKGWRSIRFWLTTERYMHSSLKIRQRVQYYYLPDKFPEGQFYCSSSNNPDISLIKRLRFIDVPIRKKFAPFFADFKVLCIQRRYYIADSLAKF